MSEILDKATEAVKQGISSFCRFITANDVGSTGSHQSGFYISKHAWPLLFDAPGVRGENKSLPIQIKWNDDLVTDSRAIYYGVRSRNEYRITRFGKGFPFLEEAHSGSLLVMTKMSQSAFSGFVLDHDTDIEGFLDYFDLAPNSLNRLIETKLGNPEEKGKRVADLFDALLLQYNEFPDTETMSSLARRVQASLWGLDVAAVHADPDAALLKWVSTEYRLFRIFEEREFQCAPKDVLGSLQGMLGYANSLLNRRKSRAGKSLEHHLAHLFTMENLRFEEQVKTEGNKKPDFIFPDGVSYHNLLFPDDGLTFLGAKTTCKDRWRQVLNEAGRISHKHLFTLQEGISANQLEEMINENLTLVVPATNIKTFDRRYQGRIMTLSGFITMVETKQRKYAT